MHTHEYMHAMCRYVFINEWRNVSAPNVWMFACAKDILENQTAWSNL